MQVITNKLPAEVLVMAFYLKNLFVGKNART